MKILDRKDERDKGDKKVPTCRGNTLDVEMGGENKPPPIIGGGYAVSLSSTQ